HGEPGEHPDLGTVVPGGQPRALVLADSFQADDFGLRMEGHVIEAVQATPERRLQERLEEQVAARPAVRSGAGSDMGQSAAAPVVVADRGVLDAVGEYLLGQSGGLEAAQR